MRVKGWMGLIAGFVVVGWGSSGHAAIVPAYSTTTAYTVSSTDLLNGLTPTTTTPALFGQEGTTTNLSVLSNGVFGPHGKQGTWQPETVAISNNADLTYTLPTVSVVNQITTYSAWDGGRDAQNYVVQYATAADPNTFIDIASVDFQPFPGDYGAQVSVKVDITGLTLTNVKKIRFNFGPQENGYAGYRELEAFALPEPASLSLLGLGSVVLVGRRRAR